MAENKAAKNKAVISFNIYYQQILEPTGKLVAELPDFGKDPKQVLAMYKTMLLTRIFDTKAVALQRTGKLGTYPSSLGQEAVSVGVGSAMQKQDVLCPYYRECGAQLWRGVKIEEILNFWGGNELGSCFSGPKEDLSFCIPIGSQTLHAAGVATAMKLRKQQRAAVAIVGDGGTSRGDFYEALNVAGAWNLPLVFVVNNNQWAISVPLDKQTKTETIAQKGIAGGVPGQQVDGNDIIAVRQAVTEALEKAYTGKGPSLIEAITYRLCDHTTADDASRYRSDDEVADAKTKDPITRLKKYLLKTNNWTEEQDQELNNNISEQVKKSVDLYLNTEPQPIESIFDYLYAELPEPLRKQREELRINN